MQSDAKTVDEYLKEVPEERRAALTHLRELCREILTGYEETMEYGGPVYKRKGGEAEVGFASQKHFIGFYILRQSVLDRHRQALAGVSVGKGTIRYRKPSQIDFDVVRKLLEGSCAADGPIC